jgi:hypothetical protein
MRHRRLVAVLPLLAMLALAVGPAPALADHCGADATVTPASGPAGTTFVFSTDLGAPSDLSLYREGTLVRSVPLEAVGPVHYEIRTGAGDAGSWRARAVVRGSPACAAEASFTVVGTPDTSTDAPPAPRPLPWLLVLVAGAIVSRLVFQRARSGRRA